MRYLNSTPLTLDAKGRMMMPAKYRDLLMEECEGKLYMTRSPDGCLLLLPLPVWNKLAEQMMDWGDDLSVFRQVYFSFAELVTWDSAGRILIPASLRLAAKLDKELLLLGNGSHFRIWNAQVFEDLVQQTMAAGKPEAVKSLKF